VLGLYEIQLLFCVAAFFYYCGIVSRSNVSLLE
jgi:hypothetical protein